MHSTARFYNHSNNGLPRNDGCIVYHRNSQQLNASYAHVHNVRSLYTFKSDRTAVRPQMSFITTVHL